MAHFDKKSRYVRFSEMEDATDRRGRTVKALTPATIPSAPPLGEHIARQGQRLDHLANHYLGDPNGYWKIASANDALLPDSVTRRSHIRIPTKR